MRRYLALFVIVALLAISVSAEENISENLTISSFYLTTNSTLVNETIIDETLLNESINNFSEDKIEDELMIINETIDSSNDPHNITENESFVSEEESFAAIDNFSLDEDKTNLTTNTTNSSKDKSIFNKLNNVINGARFSIQGIVNTILKAVFDLGTYFNTEYNTTSNSVALQYYSQNNRTLPDNGAYDSVTGINMSGNVLLLHGDTLSNNNYISGKVGNALQFDGVNDNIRLNLSSSLNFTRNYTLSAWVRPYSATAMTVMKRGIDLATAVSQQYDLQMNAGRTISLILSNGTGTGQTLTTTGTIPLNEWSLLTVVVNGTHGLIYINNTLNLTTAFTQGSQTIASTTQLIGAITAAGTTNPFNGSMDQIRIWNRTLSGVEITNIYSNESTGVVDPNMNRTGLVAEWLFENVSDSYYVYSANDSSNTGNVGTLTNMLEPNSTDSSGSGLIWPARNGVLFNDSSSFLGYSMVFDGTNDFINLTGLNSSTGNISFIAWVKSNQSDTTSKTLFASQGNNAERFGLMWFTADGSQTGYYDWADASQTQSLGHASNDGNWHHLAYVIDSQSHIGKFFRDGRFAARFMVTPNLTISNQSAIGSSFAGDQWYFNGSMDEIAIFNRTLSDAEIYNIYSKQLGVYGLGSSGNYTSSVIDAGESVSWRNISLSANSFGELPSSNAVEGNPGSTSVNMTGNVLLWHFNNVSGDNIVETDYSGSSNNGSRYGFSDIVFKKNEYNAVLSSSGLSQTTGAPDSYHTYMESVVWNGTAYIGYSSISDGASTIYRIGIFSSTNGVNWSRVAIFDPLGTEYQWDDYQVHSPIVVYNESFGWKMWYCGQSFAEQLTCRIMYATSTDGITWTRGNNGNPVLNVGVSGSQDDYSVFPGSVLWNGTTYQMWYSGLDLSTYRIFYATSTDGITWTKQNSGTAVVNIGATGKFDSTHAYKPKVYWNGTTYQMFYTGYNSTALYRMGYATSTDGITWTKQNSGNEVMSGTAAKFDASGVLNGALYWNGTAFHLWYGGSNTYWTTGYAISTNGLSWTKQNSGNAVIGRNVFRYFDSTFVYGPSILWNGTGYQMWYWGYNGTYYEIGYAFSPDGLSWTKYSERPSNYSYRSVLNRTAGKFDDTHVYQPSVLWNGTGYQMWYSGQIGFDIGYATSSDGITWTKQNSGNAVLTDGPAGKFDSDHAISPSVIWNGTTYQMWYNGYNDNSEYTIGYATSSDGITWTKQNNGNAVIGLGGSSNFDKDYAFNPSVVYVNGTYYMWYAGLDVSNRYSIGYATSSDGITWTKKGNGHSVLMARIGNGYGDTGYYANEPSVMYNESSGWKMWFGAGYYPYSIYYAYQTNDTSQGVYGNGNYFNADPYVALSDVNRLNFERTDAFSIEGWIKTNYSETQYIVMKTDRGTGNGYAFYIDNGVTPAKTLKFTLRNDSGAGFWIDGVSKNLNDNSWHHVAVTYDGSSTSAGVKLYVDGVQGQKNYASNVNTISSGSTTSGARFIVGGSEYNVNMYPFDGYIDEIAVYNRSLSADEIYARYQRGMVDLNLSVRSCDDALCDGESFTSISDSNFSNLSIANNRYFQYKYDFMTSNGAFTPSIYNVTVGYNDIVSPEVTLNNPANNSNLSASMLNFSFTAVDKQSTSFNCSLYIDNSIYATNSSTLNNTLTPLSNNSNILQGVHNWYVACIDQESNIGYSENRTFYLDITNPNASLTSPANNSYTNNNQPNFTSSFSDNLGIANVTLFILNAVGSVVNQTTIALNGALTATVGIVVNLVDGVYTWFYNVIDVVGNIGYSSNQTIVIDTANPLLDFGGNVLANNANASQSYIFVNVSVTELNPKNITFNLYNSTTLINSSSFLMANNASNTTINWTGLSDSIHYYNVSVYDLAGNYNVSETRMIRLDTTSPVLHSLSYSPNDFNDIDPEAVMSFSVNVSDSFLGVSEVLLELYNGSWTNYSMQNLGEGIYQKNITLGLNELNYTFAIYANDSIGNSYRRANQTFESAWDCTFAISPSDLGSVSGFDETKYLGSLSLNNTGDSNHSSGCVLNLRLSHSLSSGRILFDGLALSTRDYYNIAPKTSVNVTVNATFLSDLAEETGRITATDLGGISSTRTRNSTFILVSSSGQPYLSLTNEGESSYAVSLTNSDLEIKSYLRNIPADGTINTTAYNVSYSYILPNYFLISSGNAEVSYENISNNSYFYNYINLTFNETNLVDLSPGIKTIEVNAYGYDYLGNLIVHSNNRTAITVNISINLQCYNASDGIQVSACGSLDSDNPVESGNTTIIVETGSGGSSGGGGGGGAGSVETKIDYIFVRGQTSEIVIPFKNTNANGSLTDLKIIVNGDIAKYIDVVTNNIPLLLPGQETNIILRVNSPSYLKLGKQDVVLVISGKLGAEGYNENKKIVLQVVEISKDDAINLLNRSIDLISQLKQLNITVAQLEVLYSDAEKGFNELHYEILVDRYQRIEKLAGDALSADKIIKELTELERIADEKGINNDGSRRILKLAQLSLSRGDYEEAYLRAKEAQSVFAYEYKGEIGKLSYYVKNYPKQISFSAIFLLLLGFTTFKVGQMGVINGRIKKMRQEEKIFQQLIKVVQVETFEKKMMSMEEYEQSMKYYETKLSEIIEKLIELEGKRAYALKFSKGGTRLKQERQRIVELIKDIQKQYLQQKKIETKAYEIRLESYNRRLGEIDESLANLEAREALRGKSGFVGLFGSN